MVNWSWDWNAPSLVSQLTVKARVGGEVGQGYLKSHARVFSPESETVDERGVQVLVKRYVDLFRFLPEIYHRDLSDLSEHGPKDYDRCKKC